MDAMFSLIGPQAFAIAAAVALVGGFVKGTVGFALPLVMMSGMAAFLPPEVALAGLIGSVFLSNIWQALRQGRRAAFETALKHWRFGAIVLVGMTFSAQLLPLLPQTALLLILGVPVSIFAVMQLAGLQIRVSPERRGRAELGFGTVAGILGGLSGVWGPPTVAYLLAIGTEKSEQVRVQGVVFFLGSLVLVAAHLQSGVLNAQTIPFSLALIVPAMLGMWLGFKAQDRMNRDQFLRATLVVLLIAGLNLIRRGLIG